MKYLISKISKHSNITSNGYKWICQDKGVHSFQKEEGRGKWAIIECSTEQIFNGDLEFMTKHGWTLSTEQKSKIRRKYLKLAA